MHRTESATCFTNEIRKRWPRWTPSDVEASDWLVWLEKYEYADIAEAARAHLAESRYAKPIPSQLLDHARTLRAKNRSTQTGPKRPQKNASGIPDEHTFIMCVAKGDNGRGCVGHFVPILIWPFHTTYTADTYRRIAEEQCVIHSRNGRNGVWEPFYNTTHLEMMRRANQLCGTKPLDINEVRKRYKRTAMRS